MNKVMKILHNIKEGYNKCESNELVCIQNKLNVPITKVFYIYSILNV